MKHSSKAAIETNVALICSCAVVLKPFFRRHVAGFLGSASTDVNTPSRTSFGGTLISRFGRQHKSPTFQLTSMDGPEAPKAAKVYAGTKGITVNQTYDVTRHSVHREFDTESTEDMIKSVGKGSIGNEKPPSPSV
ncbi:hypothetical protein K432DRAFT_411564 [Lepidopterella palustris CBS 459.81]|uniref:Uncharacterized protein n=1 Tax=Lepidopterella palustris CBS 459.81 TaxID=1314670 RepID=A0A8E2J7P8_9PEZI|nr:hypothetical protein K432DRAFT_411564 [Lepidopterella palustris CBS 459.81]